MINDEGKKFDQGKLDFSLVPVNAWKEIVSVLTFGKKKYGADNWKYVADSSSRYYSAALRHVTAWREGEVIDKESGKAHLAHAICCLLFLLYTDLLVIQYDKQSKEEETND